MGGRLSVPEEVYSAVKAGDLVKLQALADQIRQQAHVTGHAQQALSWQDIEGRTALHVAAHRNLLRHMELLLASGADVHLNTGTRPTSGTPLHDAVHGKHDLMVDLLLRQGANPFVENLSGKTPYDLAVDSGNLGMIRKLERCSIYAAYISFKVLAFKGFATAAKDRWCVVLPRYLMQQPGQSYITVRVMLWLYRDAASVEPRTKVWLDGATVVQANTLGAREAQLRLHPNHEQPPNVYCKYTQGWTLYFSPAVGGGEPGVSLQQFQHFVQACASPLAPAPAPPPPAAAAAAAAAGGGVAYPPVPPPMAGPTGGSTAAGAAGYGSGGAGGAVRPPASWSSAPMAAAPAPPSSAAAAGGGPPSGTPTAAAPSPWSPLATAGGSQDEGGLAALPGESDEEFARRLSSHLNLSEGLPSRHSSSSNPFLSPTHSGVPAPQQTQPQQQQQQPQQQPAQQPVSRLGSSAPSAPPAPSGMAAAAGARGGAAAAAAGPRPTPLTSNPPAAGVKGGSGSIHEDDGQCVICMSEASEVALLHGDDAHKCVCRECARMVRLGQPCPMCRRPVERLVRLY